MLSVQDVGTQILGGNPGKFYVLGGTEYGIKEKYINILKTHYNGNQVESPTVSDILNLMGKKHIIPLVPSVYVIRYDDTFVSSLSEDVCKKIDELNIIGTVVCIYESTKHVNKCDKYLPHYTASIDCVSPQFVCKYLHSDFPKLPDNLIKIAVSCSSDYGQAKNMCRCMNCVPHESLYKLSDGQISALFGYQDTSTEIQIRKGVASRQFNYLVEVANKYPESGDRIIYAILQTMIELDKSMDSPKSQSDVRDYLKFWTREDIYYMFMNTYEELQKLRSLSSYDVNNSLIYLFGLLKFSRIPSPEVMKS